MINKVKFVLEVKFAYYCIIPKKLTKPSKRFRLFYSYQTLSLTRKDTIEQLKIKNNLSQQVAVNKAKYL